MCTYQTPHSQPLLNGNHKRIPHPRKKVRLRHRDLGRLIRVHRLQVQAQQRRAHQFDQLDIILFSSKRTNPRCNLGGETKRVTHLHHRHILPDTAPGPNPKRNPIPQHILGRHRLPARRHRTLNPPLRHKHPGIAPKSLLVQMHRHRRHAHRSPGREVRPRHDASAGGYVPREVDGSRGREAEGFLDAGLQVGETA